MSKYNAINEAQKLFNSKSAIDPTMIAVNGRIYCIKSEQEKLARKIKGRAGLNYLFGITLK